MASTKVLVVDDSLTMRALISGALERIPQVEVVGVADGADEARAMCNSLRPDVMTLDVEMPGMSGLEYLAELMEKRPMPVIMFSTRTKAGAEDSVEARRLGAIDCFPKPRVASPAELDKIIAQLGKRIKAARGVELRGTKVKAAPAAAPALNWNGRLLAIGGDASSTQMLFDLFETFPKNCPPTVVVQHLGSALAESMVRKIDGAVAPRVVLAEHGMALEQGMIYFAPPGDAHMVVDAWPQGRLKMLARDPVSGERPSISVLLASVGKAAGTEAIGLLLASASEDGVAGMKALIAGGGAGVTSAPDGAPGFVVTRNAVSHSLTRDELAGGLLKLLAK